MDNIILVCKFSRIGEFGEFANSIFPRCGIENAQSECEDLRVCAI